MGPASHSRRPHQRHCGTGIWPDRDIAACWRELESPARLCRPRRQASRPHPRGKPGFSTLERGCGRETDSLLEGAVTSELVSEVKSPEPSQKLDFRGVLDDTDSVRRYFALEFAGNCTSSPEGRPRYPRVTPCYHACFADGRIVAGELTVYKKSRLRPRMPVPASKLIGLQPFTGPQRIVEFTVMSTVLSTTINRGIL